MSKVNKTFLKKAYSTFIVLVILIVFIYLIYKSRIFKEIFFVTFFSYILAYVLKPLHHWLYKKGVNKKIAAFFLLSIIMGFFSLIIIYLIPSLFRESLNIELIISEGEKFVNDMMRGFNLNNLKFLNITNELIYEKINEIIMELSQNVVNTLVKLGESFISLAVIPVITYYLISDGDLLNNKLLLILPTKKRQVFKKVSQDVDKILSRYIVSQLILCFIIGILTFSFLSF